MQEVELRPHQRKAVSELHNGAILCGGVGVGKSRVAMQYYIEKEAPKDVYIITTAKKRDSLDWETEAVLHGVGTSGDATFHGVVHVDSWNNLWRYVDIENAFFIFDEQRLVGSGAWVGVFQKIAKKNHWILLSATPGDTWLDYIPVFVANGFYKNRTEFLREHVVYSRYSKFPKVDRYIAVGRLVRHRNALLVDMPYLRHTNRIVKDVLVDYDEDLFKKVVKDRWHVYEHRPLRDVAELFLVMRKVVNSDLSRIQKIQTLLQEHPKLIIFYNFDYELELLRTLADTALPRTSSGNLLGNSLSEEQHEPCLSKSSESCPLLSKNRHRTPTATSNGEPSEDSNQHTSSPRKCWTPTDIKLSSPIHQYKTQEDGPKDVTTTTQLMPICSPTNSPELETNDLRGSQRPDFALGNRRSIQKVHILPSTDVKQPPQISPFNGNTSVLQKIVSITSTVSKTPVVFAEWNGKKHEEIPKTDSWVYLVQYAAGAEGWNCVETDTVVFYSLNYSYRAFEQCQGRIDRLNTPFVDLNYYVFKSKSEIDKMIWQALRVKKKFNEPKTEETLRGLKMDF